MEEFMISKQQCSNVGPTSLLLRVGRLVPVVLLTLGLSSMPASAETNTASKNSKATSAAKLDYLSAGRLRSYPATIGKQQGNSLSDRPSNSQQRAKSESSMVASKKKYVRATSVKPVNAYQQAFQSLRQVASKVAPTESARAEVSFVVGPQGQPMRPAIVGVSPTLTKELVSHLHQLRFPKEHAGQFYASKISIVAMAVASPVKAPKSKRSNRKKLARRNAR